MCQQPREAVNLGVFDLLGGRGMGIQCGHRDHDGQGLSETIRTEKGPLTLIGRGARPRQYGMVRCEWEMAPKRNSGKAGLGTVLSAGTVPTSTRHRRVGEHRFAGQSWRLPILLGKHGDLIQLGLTVFTL